MQHHAIFYAMGRGGALPAILGKTNRHGSPFAGVGFTSAITLPIFLFFAIKKLEPINNLFFWMSAITSLAIIFVEILVCISILAYFRNKNVENFWKVKVAPAVAIVILSIGEYLLLARFNLLSGLVPKGVDPSNIHSAFKISTGGWLLALSPFIAAAIGFLIQAIYKRENDDLVKDILS